MREEDFTVSVATMEGRIDADEAGLRRTAIADAALDALLPPVLADFAARFGRVRGGAMAVVALGKAGGREMMAGSDLDLMLVYDHPPDVSESRGARRLPVEPMVRPRRARLCRGRDRARAWTARFTQVDMRLRPSGNKGPVAVSLGSFRRYHAGIGLDLGAHGADACPRGGRSTGAARPHRGGDRGSAGAGRRCRHASAPMPRRCARACCATCRRTGRGT